MGIKKDIQGEMEYKVRSILIDEDSSWEITCKLNKVADKQKGKASVFQVKS